MRDISYPLSQCPYCPLARPAGEIRFIEDTYYERWGSHLLGTSRRYSISCTLCNRPGDTIAEGFTSLEAAITAARGHAKHHNENYAEEHANGHPRQPPNKPQPLPQPPQRIPIAQAPARYGGTWWAVCHLSHLLLDPPSKQLGRSHSPPQRTHHRPPDRRNHPCPVNGP